MDITHDTSAMVRLMYHREPDLPAIKNYSDMLASQRQYYRIKHQFMVSVYSTVCIKKRHLIFMRIFALFYSTKDVWPSGLLAQLRPVYTNDFCCDIRCDFLLLRDVKEWISYKCSRRMQ